MNVQNPSASRGIAIQAVDLVKNYGTGSNMVPVSYTHLDVYKRQTMGESTGFSAMRAAIV